MNNENNLIPRYYLFLYLRNTVYYIRLKYLNKNVSLSLKTSNRRVALKHFKIFNHALILHIQEMQIASYEQLVKHFKNIVQSEFNSKNIHSNDSTVLTTPQLINNIKDYSLSIIEKQSISISQLCDDYIQEKGNNWKHATQLSSIANKKLFIEIFNYLGLDDVKEVTRKDMLEIREVIKQLPINRKQIFKELPLKEVLQQQDYKTLSTRTINGHLIFLSSVLNWAEKNDLIRKNLATDLLIKDTQKESEKRQVFTVHQIQQILSSCKNHSIKNGLAWQYYIPLLSAITGARLNEICQLQVKDVIKTKDNTLCLDINADGVEGKSLKNKYSARYVPLIDGAFGFDANLFMHYVLSRGNKNNLLFDVTWTDKGRYSDKVSKWFNRTLLKQALKDPNSLSFHSFRHSIATLLKNSGTPLVIAQQLLGHSSQSITYDTYGKEIQLKKLYQYLNECFEKIP